MKKLLILLFCAVFLISGIPGTAFAAEKTTAELIEMGGDVQVIRSGGEKPFKAFVSMKLAEGDKIITGPKGFAKIKMDKDVIITLAENTKISISELRGSKGASQSSVNLQTGGVGTSVKEKLTDNSRFEIKTPTAVMGVRGTEFFTQYFNGNVDVRVVNGVVEVRTTVTYSDTGDGERTEDYTFYLYPLQQAEFSGGDTAGEIRGSIEPLETDGLSLPFLERLQEISSANPGAIPAEVADTLTQAINDAITEINNRIAQGNLPPDELASALERQIAGNLRESRSATTPPPPSGGSSGGSGPSGPSDPTGPTGPIGETYRLALTGGGLTISNSLNSSAIPKNTWVTITVTPPVGNRIATFTVNGADKKSELSDNTYSFQMTSNTTVDVTYEIPPLFDVYYHYMENPASITFDYKPGSPENENLLVLQLETDEEGVAWSAGIAPPPSPSPFGNAEKYSISFNDNAKTLVITVKGAFEGRLSITGKIKDSREFTRYIDLKVVDQVINFSANYYNGECFGLNISETAIHPILSSVDVDIRSYDEISDSFKIFHSFTLNKVDPIYDVTIANPLPGGTTDGNPGTSAGYSTAGWFVEWPASSVLTDAIIKGVNVTFTLILHPTRNDFPTLTLIYNYPYPPVPPDPSDPPDV
ncbi:hypothetical protein MASR2M70_12380 [Bacillota bacterium]